MVKKIHVVALTCILLLSTISGCASITDATEKTKMETAQFEPTAISTSQTQENEILAIYTPASTSSIPVIIAANQLENRDLHLYSNQSQANTIFLRGETQLLVSGLSVGVDLYKNEAPIQIVNSFISGLSYLVTYEKPVSGFSELSGKTIYIPFEGSPIEEVTSFLVEQEDLTWNSEITPVYSPFDSSVELLKQGKATAVILPEPFVTLVEEQPNIYISLNLYDEWNKYTGTNTGYPQVATFANPDWASSNGGYIKEFNSALAEAIEYVKQNPEKAVNEVKEYYKLPSEKLLKALNRTQYQITSGTEMKMTIDNYYKVIGEQLDENFADFYFFPAQ